MRRPHQGSHFTETIKEIPSLIPRNTIPRPGICMPPNVLTLYHVFREVLNVTCFSKEFVLLSPKLFSWTTLKISVKITHTQTHMTFNISSYLRNVFEIKILNATFKSVIPIFHCSKVYVHVHVLTFLARTSVYHTFLPLSTGIYPKVLNTQDPYITQRTGHAKVL